MANTRRAKPDVNGSAKIDVRALIASAKRPERIVPVCLRGDLIAQLNHLEQQLRARRNPADRLVGDPEARALAEQIAALQEQMREATIEFTLRAIPRRDMVQFIIDHRPREGNDADRAANINLETYFPELVERCLVDPELTHREYVALVGGTYVDPDDSSVEPEEFDGALGAGQFEQLAEAASVLNMSGVSVPFSPSASVILQSSDESSKRPRASESLPSDSAAGSPPK